MLLRSVCTLADEAGVEGRAGADHDQRGARHRGLLEQRLAPQQHVGAGVDRQGAVEDRARRRGALHRPRQPAGERHLRRLAEGREHEQQRHDRGRRRRARGRCRGASWRRTAGRSRPDPTARWITTLAASRPDVADPVGGEGPQRRPDRVGPLVEEADQQGRGDAEALPAGEQHVDAVGEHHEVHARAEQRQQDEEPGEARLAVEVLAGEGVHQPAQAGGEADVGHREGVGHEVDRGLVVADREPGADVDHLRREAPCARGRRASRSRGDESHREAGPHESRVVARSEAAGPAAPAAPTSRRASPPVRRAGTTTSSGDDDRGPVMVRASCAAALRRAEAPPATRAGGRWSRWPAIPVDRPVDDRARGCIRHEGHESGRRRTPRMLPCRDPRRRAGSSD